MAVVVVAAVKTCPIIGAVAAEITTSVVAVLKLDAETIFVVPVIVLFVNVSVVLLATNVLAPVGRVNVPPLFIVDIIGAVNVLFVNVSVVVLPTNVLVPVGRVNVPPLVIVPIVGAVNVLFVKVSVLVLVTIVSVILGRVSVRLAVWLDARVTVVPVVAPAFSKLSLFVASTLSIIKVVLSTKLPPVTGVCQLAVVAEVAVRICPAMGAVAADITTSAVAVLKLEADTVLVVLVIVLFVNVSIVFLAIIVSVPVGRVSVPLFIIVLIDGEVNVLLVNVSLLVLVTIVSDMSGNVKVLLAV